MKCLGKCEGDCLDWFIGSGDRGRPIYHLAEDLAPAHDAEECYRACQMLEGIGLIKNIGTSSKIYKLSAPAMGDVAKRFFSAAGSESQELKELRMQLLEIQLAQKEAAESAEAAAQQSRSGGIVSKRQLDEAIAKRDAERKESQN